MNLRDKFKAKHPIFSGVDENDQFFDFYSSGYRDGASDKHNEIANDREMLEGLLQEMDYQDELQEQEQLRRGG